MIVAHELGLIDRITCVRTVVDPLTPNLELMQDNPLSKIPTLVLEDGTALYDSPVICQYFDSLHEGPKLFPAELKQRLTALRRQALGDGFVEFLLLLRNERARTHPSQALLAAFGAKQRAVLGRLDTEASELAASPFTIGHVAIGSALCYLNFRFADYDWGSEHGRIAWWHEEFCARPSVLATELVDDIDAPVSYDRAKSAIAARRSK
jgi:glutathione S-transferase